MFRNSTRKMPRQNELDEVARVLALAQQTADLAIANAQEEAAKIIARAHREAERIIAEAQAHTWGT